MPKRHSRAAQLAVVAALLLVGAPMGLIGIFGAADGGSATAAISPSAAPSAFALGTIPEIDLNAFEEASNLVCPAMPWQDLAANVYWQDRSYDPSVVNSIGAAGIMQFMPSTWSEYSSGAYAAVMTLAEEHGGANPPTPLDPVDASFAAAADVCANGAATDLVDAWGAYAGGCPAGVPVGSTDPSSTDPADCGPTYGELVVNTAQAYSTTLATTSGSATGEEIVALAEQQIGVPYVWGGASPSAGFDCSGLVQYVYGQAGVNVPRTSEEQFTIGTPVASLADAIPGDLIFYVGEGDGGTTTAPGHVAIYAGDGEMVQAPETGEDVDLVPVATGWVGIRRVITSGLLSSPGNTASTPGTVQLDSTPSATQQVIASAASSELSTRCPDSACSAQLTFALAAAGVSTAGTIASLAQLSPVVAAGTPIVAGDVVLYGTASLSTPSLAGIVLPNGKVAVASGGTFASMALGSPPASIDGLIYLGARAPGA